MIIKQSDFKISVKSLEQAPKDFVEFAFAGRSNSGKSSLINMLTNRKNLAISSSKPGRTRMINYFLINEKTEGPFYFVDLPGYGYSKSGKALQIEFSELIEEYLGKATRLKHIFILCDARIKPSEMDKNMLKFCTEFSIPFSFVLTKCDKLKRSEIEKFKQSAATELYLGKDNLILTDIKGLGKDKIFKIIEKGILTEIIE